MNFPKLIQKLISFKHVYENTILSNCLKTFILHINADIGERKTDVYEMKLIFW